MQPVEREREGSLVSGIVVVIATSLVVRGLFLMLRPTEAISIDLRSWVRVIELLRAGLNPYHETAVLNHPPFWMQCLFVIKGFAAATGCPVPLAVIGALVLVEQIVIGLVFATLRSLTNTRVAMVTTLLGFSLNPAAVHQTTQHANFDVIVGLWVLLAVRRLVRFAQAHDPADWLAAACYVGLGIWTKLTPIVLIPLLAAGIRHVPVRQRWLGVALAFGPAFVGMSVLTTLVPADVWEKVIRYRSIGGYYGLSGLLSHAGATDAMQFLGTAFGLAVPAVIVVLSIKWWGRDLPAAAVVFAATALLLAVPTFGPGFGPQYIYWFWPPLAVSVAFGGRAWRVWLGVVCAVTAATYAVEYALLPSHGAWLAMAYPQDESLYSSAMSFNAPWAQTKLRLPLFVVSVITVVALAVRTYRTPTVPPASTG